MKRSGIVVLRSASQINISHIFTGLIQIAFFVVSLFIISFKLFYHIIGFAILLIKYFSIFPKRILIIVFIIKRQIIFSIYFHIACSRFFDRICTLASIRRFRHHIYKHPDTPRILSVFALCDQCRVNRIRRLCAVKIGL